MRTQGRAGLWRVYSGLCLAGLGAAIILFILNPGGFMNAVRNLLDPSPAPAVIPAPLEMTLSGAQIELRAGLSISTEPLTPEMNALAQYLADRINPATGLQLRPGSPAQNGDGIFLRLDAGDAS